MIFDDVLNLWEKLDELAHPYLAPIETEAQYREALSLLEIVWEKAANNPDSPYITLLSVLTDNVNAYETTHHDIEDAKPEQVLAYLMEENGLTQKELEAATGIHQSNLSVILKGKRNLTTGQIKKLAEFFKVNPEVFL